MFTRSHLPGPDGVTVAMVNQEFARRFGFGADIVGHHLYEPGTPIEIVGMVGNVRVRGLRARMAANGGLRGLVSGRSLEA